MKRIRPETNEEEEELNLLELPFDMIVHTMSHLSVPDLLATSLVCKALNNVSENDRVWFPLCRSLWHGKQLYHNKTDKEELSWKEEYIHSLEDSKRTTITPEELCRFQWLYSYSVRFAEQVTHVMEARFDPTGYFAIKGGRSSVKQWTLMSDRLSINMHFGSFIYIISRNVADWGWNIMSPLDLFQTLDPNLPAARPLVQICTRVDAYLTNGTLGKDGKTILLDQFDVDKIAIMNAGIDSSDSGDGENDSDFDSSYDEEEEVWKD